MIRRPPRSTRTDTLFPYTTLFRADGLDVAVVGAAAAAQDVDLGQATAQRAILLPEFGGIAVVERLRCVELRMAELRGVGAQAPDALHPALARLQRIFEVGRMRAVDHVVGRAPAGRRVHRGNGIFQGLRSEEHTSELQSLMR